jgi:hypothetical protein
MLTRDNYRRTSTTVALLLVLSMSAGQADDVTDRAVWVSNAVNRISTQDKWEYLDFLSLIVDVKNETGKSLGTAENLLRNKLLADAPNAGTSPAVERANRVYSWLSEAGPTGAAVSDFLKDRLRNVSQETDLRYVLDSAVADHNTFSRNFPRAERVMAAIYDLALKDSEFRGAFDGVYGRFFRANIGSGADKILQANPEFASLEYIRDLSKNSSDMKVDIQKLRQTVLTDFTAQAAKLDGLTRDALEERAQIRALALTYADVARQLEAQRKRQQEAAYQAFLMEGMRSGVTLIAAMLPHDQDSRNFMLYANTALDIYEAISKFNNYTSEQEGNETAEDMAAISTFTTIVVKFWFMYQQQHHEKAPLPEQILYEALVKISEQIKAFQQNVNDRFDRVDKALNTIYRTLVNGLEEAITGIHDVRADTGKIRRSLSRIVDRMDIYQGEIIDRLEFLIDHSFRTKVQECLAYHDLAGRDLQRDEYVSCVAAIRGYFLTCDSPTRSGRWDPTALAKLATLEARFSQGDWQSHVNFLRGIAKNEAAISLSGERANPLCWLVAARTYRQLAGQNIELFRQLPMSFLDELQSEGFMGAYEFSDFIRGDQASKLLVLYGRLLKLYHDALDKFGSATRNVRQSILDTLKVKLDDPGTDLLGQTVPEALAKGMRERPIFHVAVGQEGFREARQEKGFFGPPFPLTGAQGWPNIEGSSAANVWEVVLTIPWLRDLELLGLGTLRIGYVASIEDVKHQTSDYGVETLRGKPAIKYLVYLYDKDDKARLVAESELLLGVSTYIYVRPPVTGVMTQLAVNEVFDFQDNIRKNTIPWAMPGKLLRPQKTTSADGKGTNLDQEIAEQAKKIRSEMQAAVYNELGLSGSDAAAALSELTATSQLIQIVSALIFPQNTTTDPNFRHVLFGDLRQPHTGYRF